MDRRSFLQSAVFATLASTVRASTKRPPRLLVRSSWQTVNIGDIAHTPGLLAILEKHLPDVEVRLWPSKVDNGVEELLLDRFPRLSIVKTPEALKTAFDECDFLLHGSAASFGARKDVIRWREETGKPFGVYGITLPLTPSTSTSPTSEAEFAKTIEVLGDARFVYFRDSVSLELARSRGCACPIMEFGPDAAFGVDLLDDERALAFLKAHDLEEGRFLCCIPRLRYTPYWTLPGRGASFDPKKHARNEAMKEHDHAPHRRAIIEIIRQTDHKVLLCPEDQTQMAVGKDLLYDPLPETIKRRVVWRPDYWLTGEAISTYIRSAGLFGNEMHSPIMSVSHGVPAIVCRWAEQTSKGFMWRDIGLADWLFDFGNEDDVSRLVPTVLSIATDPGSAKAKADKARSFVRDRQRQTMTTLGQQLA